MLDAATPLILSPSRQRRHPHRPRPARLAAARARGGARRAGDARAQDRPGGHSPGRQHRQVRAGDRLRDQADRGGRARPHATIASSGRTTRSTRSASTSRRRRRRCRRWRRGPSRASGAPTARSGRATTSRVCATVNCSATVIRRAAEQVMASGILADYPNVDGVVAFAHGTGCGMAASGPGFDNLQRVLWGHATHANVGAAVFVGLGCEVMQVARMKSAFGSTGSGALPRADDPGHRRDDEDHREDRRANPCAAAGGEPERARAGAGVGAQGGARVRRVGRVLGGHRQPGARAWRRTCWSGSGGRRSSPRRRRSTGRSSCCCGGR